MALVNFNKQLQVTELDFDQIKQNLKTHFVRTDSKFKDWDWEGSGLNSLLDILAYNTHYNAVLAHTAFNESFIDSAQIRNNVVSHAKLLGYVPRSRNSATAIVKLVQPTYFSIGTSDTKFTTEVSGRSFTFVPEAAVSSTLVGVSHELQLVLREGTNRTDRFTVDETISRQQFVIQSPEVDTSSILVKVYSSESSVGTGTFEVYNQFNSFYGVDSTTPIYFLSQNIYGKYEIYFGNGVVGKKLNGSNIVEIDYRTTSGSEANGAALFEIASSASDVKDPTITTISPSSGGSDEESIESIRSNAPRSFITQNRAVTAVDYINLIQRVPGVSEIRSINVWGGEEEAQVVRQLNPLADISQYAGQAYISALTSNGLLTSVEKTNITNYLRNLKVFTIGTNFVDPEYTYLYFDAYVRFDRSRTILAPSDITELVKGSIKAFSDSTLNSFSTKFALSNMLYNIQIADSAFSSVLARAYVYKKFVLTMDPDSIPYSTYKLDFGLPLYTFGDQYVQTATTIISKPIETSEGIRYLKDAPPDGDNSEGYERFVYLSENGQNITAGFGDTLVGHLNYTTGVITLVASVAFDPLILFPDLEPITIEVHAVPSTDDITPARNTVLTIDETLTIVTTQSDSGLISSNNVAPTAFDRVTTLRTL
jgi:hypothetical protein